jgi:site-specific DNA-methyltransferase (adenine-specific)
MGAKKLGLKRVPTVIADLTETQAKAYRIADNRINEDSTWDMELLNLEIAGLSEVDFDLDLLGFDSSELDKLLVNDEEYLTDEDEVPEPPKEPKSKLGDVYQLGEHRLMCGDSTMIDQVEKLMRNQKADLIFTDPPYNVNYGKLKGNQKNNNSFKERKIMNDFMDDEQFIQFLTDCFTNSKIVSKAGCSIYVCYADKQAVNFFQAMRNINFHHSCNIIWKKDSLVLGMSDYHSIHEPIIYGWFKGDSHSYYGDKKQTTVWECKRPKKNDLHPTMKPIELVEKAIKNSSKSDDILYEPFGGSGSTLIACEKTKRKCCMMELDPKYVDVIIDRWENFTGKKSKKIC